MKKLILLLAAIMAFSFAGCAEDKPKEKEITNSSEQENSSTQTVKELAQIQEEIKSALSVSGALDMDAASISSLYGIEEGDMVQAIGFVVMEGTFPHEAVMVEAKDAEAAARVEELLKEKHKAFVDQSKGYDAENYALAKKCKVERNGNYISMFLTPEYEAMQEVYKKYIK